MNLLIETYNIIIYQPLFNLLILFYEFLPGRDLSIAIIALTILVKILLYPLDVFNIRIQKVLQNIQPKIQEIQNKFKNDREKIVKETLALYKKEKVNPFNGFLPLLIQLPIFIAFFQLFSNGLKSIHPELFYNFVPKPEIINFISFGMLNLNQPNIFLAILVGACQFIQSKMLFSHKQDVQKVNAQKIDYLNEFSRIMQKQMVYIFPFLTVLILTKLPSALSIYWVITILFTILQQYFILKSKPTFN